MPELPLPDSDQLRALVPGKAARAIYRVLYGRRDQITTSAELREQIGPEFGGQEQLGRRRRQLHLAFEFANDGTGFQLLGLKPNARPQAAPISDKVRAQVLQPQRCAMCGRKPLDDGVKLVVDHKIPQDWGGGHEIENLQPLCEQCNGGKKNNFESFDAHADAIAAAIQYEEPHRRIGELLKAFGGGWVPGDLVSIVASSQQYQEDWQKRTRELRTIGWDIRTEKRYNEGARVRTYYRAAHWEPWPTARSVRAEITAAERAIKEAKRGKHSAQ